MDPDDAQLRREKRRRLLTFALRAAVLAAILTYAAAFWAGTDWAHHPTQVGTDASNYYAAGQRLNDGHQLYHLGPGDLEVPMIPPYAFTPLVSPPPIAVFWRLPALLPRDLALVAWWLTMIVLIAATTFWMTGLGSIPLTLATLVLGTEIVITGYSANINCFLLPATAAIWLAYRSGRSATVGVLLAVAVAVKVMPIVLVLWLLVGRRWRDLGWFAAAGVAIAVMSLAGAGLQAHFDWLGVVRSTNADGIAPFSLAGWALRFGLPAQSVSLVLPAALLAGLALIVVSRGRPGLAFSVAIVTAVVANPAIHDGSFTMLLPALLPLAVPLARSASPGIGDVVVRTESCLDAPATAR